MDAGTVFQKTAKGEREIASRSGALSMLDRRVLILADGKRTAEQLQKLSRVDDFPAVLQKLVSGGYVDPPKVSSDTGVNTEAREFMVNMLLAFTDRAKVAGLVTSISAAQSDEDLRRLLDDWCSAIADSPHGVTEVNNLKVKLLEILYLGPWR